MPVNPGMIECGWSLVPHDLQFNLACREKRRRIVKNGVEADKLWKELEPLVIKQMPFNEIARELNVSGPSLYNFFRHRTGLTVVKWLRQNGVTFKPNRPSRT